MNLNFLTWQQSYEAGISQCGGKGWNLARLLRFGFKVPSGGVLTSDTYNQLMVAPTISSLVQRIQIIPDNKLTEAGTAAYLEELRQMIVDVGLPEQFQEALYLFLHQQKLEGMSLAVRSSATLEDGEEASFAGIHDSYLNVNGLINIEQAILSCFASLWTLRAISYRRKMKIDDQGLSCAVVIMALVEAQSSGIAFSCDPTTGREDLCVINANFGLGESVVGGFSEPDEYQLGNQYINLVSRKVGSKTKQTILEKDGGTRLVDSIQASQTQVLSDNQTSQLGRMIQRVFWTLGNGDQHQDIEWAFDGQQFHILQARPVTVLPRLTCDGLRNQVDIWSNGNFRDAAPLVHDTMGPSIFTHQIDVILRASFEDIGYAIPDGLSFVKLFQGRLYCNASLMQWLYYDSVGFLPSATNRSMGGHQQEIKIEKHFHGGLIKKVNRLINTLKLMREMKRHHKEAQNQTAKDIEYVEQYLRSDLTSWSNEKLGDHLKKCEKRIEAYALPFIMLTSRSGSMLMLFDVLEKYLPKTSTATATALLSGIGEITSADHGYRLQELAALVEKDREAKAFFNKNPFEPSQWMGLPDSSLFKQAFRNFIDEYGHRAVYEIYLSNPRWREDQSYLLQVIRQSIGGYPLSKLKQQQQKKSDKAWATVQNEVPFYMRLMVKSLVRQAADGAASKEMAKSNYIRLLEPLRLLILEAGRRFKASGLLTSSDDIFHCAMIEVISLLNGEWGGEGLDYLIMSRKTQKEAWEDLAAPDVILDDEPHYSKPARQSLDGGLIGLGVAAGCAEGMARLIRSPDECTALKAGDVLVAPSTDPAWTPLFLNASAIVMETGGQLSHGAIVAREYGIPAVVNIPGLFKIITDGDRIIVDGNQGIVKKQ